jgi:hypothetical protein
VLGNLGQSILRQRLGAAAFAGGSKVRRCGGGSGSGGGGGGGGMAAAAAAGRKLNPRGLSVFAIVRLVPSTIGELVVFARPMCTGAMVLLPQSSRSVAVESAGSSIIVEPVPLSLSSSSCAISIAAAAVAPSRSTFAPGGSSPAVEAACQPATATRPPARQDSWR